MGNKQKEVEATALLESYDIVAITETWWDESHDWSVAIEGYKLFRRDRQGRRGGGFALYVKEWIESEGMSLKASLASDERVESLWVRIKGQANVRDTVVGVYYRPPDQDGEVDEAFYNQLQVTLQSQALVLVGDFNHPDICWRGYTAKHLQSRRFLQCINDNFFTQLVEEPTRRGALLDLVLTNKEGLVEDIKDECIPKSKKSGKGSRRPAWLSRELLKKLKWKKEVYTEWKKGLTAWKGYKNAIRVCRDETRKAKAPLKLKLARDVKVNKKGFFNYIGGKMKTKENVGPLLKESGTMVTEDAGKAELLNAFFASVFTAQASPQEPWTLEESVNVWTKEDLPLVEEDQVRE
ncbi:hypothetical protein llap_3459 [Limosa lapponica baueri]|uniref:Endonuclease/exonuclease/phosphatase domain-containing protein n=1 Tax=Limosa lapponica baueri TaxID=1758121 RepID=A0A2I0UJL1_LIMLA|nr:hypothetical protein llap_3459 [Limosa lapponica baueri]